MILNEKFKFEQVMKDGKKIVMLRGTIDEDTTFTQMAKLGSSLVFNFKGVTAINSLGVRGWVNFIKDILNVEIMYEECPPLIVRQLNMVPSFKGHATVTSVYVPYVCDNCDTESLALVEKENFAGISETIPCESCKKGEMELDGTPEQYFAFQK